jgi:hypothetical protein
MGVSLKVTRLRWKLRRSEKSFTDESPSNLITVRGYHGGRPLVEGIRLRGATAERDCVVVTRGEQEAGLLQSNPLQQGKDARQGYATFARTLRRAQLLSPDVTFRRSREDEKRSGELAS